MTPPLWQKVKKNWRASWRWKRRVRKLAKTQHSENLDNGIWSHHFMANRETVADFIFLGAKITEDGDCSHEIKRLLLLGQKVLTNLDSILKSRDITSPTKVHLVKAMVFPVVMYGCESWTIKKAEHQRIDAFELWFWRRLLRVPWTSRRSNQSILKKRSPGCSLEGLMLKLKLQYFGHLMQRVDLLEKTLMLGRIGGRRRRGRQRWDGWMASPTLWTWVWVNSGSWWWTGRPGVLWFMGSQRAGHNWATELNKRTSKINVVSLGKYALDLIMHWNDRKELGINLLARKLTQILS